MSCGQSEGMWSTLSFRRFLVNSQPWTERPTATQKNKFGRATEIETSNDFWWWMVNFFPPPTTFAHSPSFFPVRAIVEEKGPERTMNFQNVDGRNCGKMLSYWIEIRADSTPVRNGVTLNRKSRFSEPILFLSNTTRPDSIDRCDSVNEQQKNGKAASV